MPLMQDAILYFNVFAFKAIPTRLNEPRCALEKNYYKKGTFKFIKEHNYIVETYIKTVWMDNLSTLFFMQMTL